MQDANGFEDAQRTEPVGIRGVFGSFERHLHVAHGGEVVDLVRLHLLNDADQVGRVGHVAVVEPQPYPGRMRVLVEMVDAIRIEQRGAALDAMHLISLAQQELGKVGARPGP